MPAESLVGVLLAAGSGRRFGGDKLMQTLADGEPLAAAAARALVAGCDRTIAVVAADTSPALCAALRECGAELVVAADAARGMGRSLAAGIAAGRDARGWLVALADMPAIRPDTIRRVARALRDGASIAAPFHQHRRGHPVGFSREWLEALLALHGDSGARALLGEHAERIVRVDVDDGGILVDVDTPADLAALGAPGSPAD